MAEAGQPALAERAFAWGQAICRVCGQGFSAPPATCEVCQAPHHADCWSYNGGCATYGCLRARGGRRSSGPRAAPAAAARPKLEERIEIPSCAPRPLLGPERWVAAGALAVLATALGLEVLALAAAVAAGLVGGAFVLEPARRRIVRQWLLFGLPVYEANACALDGVRSLDLEPCRRRERHLKRLVARLRSGLDLPLTAPFDPLQAPGIESALARIEGAADVVVNRRPSIAPVAEALALALAREAGLRVPEPRDLE